MPVADVNLACLAPATGASAAHPPPSLQVEGGALVLDPGYSSCYATREVLQDFPRRLPVVPYSSCKRGLVKATRVSLLEYFTGTDNEVLQPHQAKLRDTLQQLESQLANIAPRCSH